MFSDAGDELLGINPGGPMYIFVEPPPATKFNCALVGVNPFKI
jgi:hypothetical protein